MLSFKNREQGERDKNQIKCKKKKMRLERALLFCEKKDQAKA